MAYAEMAIREMASGKLKISTLQTDLDVEAASRVQMNRDLAAAARELSQSENELKEATAVAIAEGDSEEERNDSRKMTEPLVSFVAGAFVRTVYA